MTITLWEIEVSHLNEKACRALDCKGLVYDLKVPMPGLHGVRAAMLTRACTAACPSLSWTAVASATRLRSSPPLEHRTLALDAASVSAPSDVVPQSCSVYSRRRRDEVLQHGVQNG